MTPCLRVKCQLSGHEMLLVTAPVRCLGNKTRYVQHEVKIINQEAMTSIQPGPHWRNLCHQNAYYDGTHTLTVLHLLYNVTLNYLTTFATSLLSCNLDRQHYAAESLLITYTEQTTFSKWWNYLPEIVLLNSISIYIRQLWCNSVKALHHIIFNKAATLSITTLKDSWTFKIKCWPRRKYKTEYNVLVKENCIKLIVIGYLIATN